MHEAELEAAVAALAERHRGEELARAVARLAETLDEAGRERLRALLLARASADGAFDRAWREPSLGKGWLRRRLEAAEERARELRRR